MKKFLLVILSLVLILSAVCVTAFAADKPKAEDAINFNLEKGLQFEIRIDDIPTTMLYVKGDKIASEMKVEGYNLKLILKNNSFYMYFTDFPFVYFEHKDSEMPDLQDALGTLQFDAEFVEAVETEYQSEIYYVEKYATDDGVTIEYYFLDDELKLLKSTDDENVTTEIEIVSTEVDDDVFELPFFAFNITPIFEFLTSFFM